MAKEVLDTIMSIQPKDSSGGTGETRESMVYRIAEDMLEKLPPDYIPHEVINYYSVCIPFKVLAGKRTSTKDGCAILHEYFLASGD